MVTQDLEKRMKDLEDRMNKLESGGFVIRLDKLEGAIFKGGWVKQLSDLEDRVKKLEAIQNKPK